MKELLLCNLLQTYQEAPVSLDIFKADTDQLISIMLNTEAKRRVIFTEDKQIEVPTEIEVIHPSKTSGFVIGNDSALLHMLEGEKPFPTKRNDLGAHSDTLIQTAEEMLGQKNKKVYIYREGMKYKVCDVPKVTTPKEILEMCGMEEPCKGMYFGYPMGQFVDGRLFEQNIELRTDYIEIYGDQDCMLDRLIHVVTRFQKESCGRCVFGYEGVTQISMILADISMKKGKISDIDQVAELARIMKKQTICEIGTALADSVMSALSCFKEEIEAHITKKCCHAGVCQKFMTYHILADRCTGCTDCTDACDDDAILGKVKFIHVIDQDECTQCGKCLEVCEEEAIVRAGAIKPKGPLKPIPCKRS